MYRNVRQLAEMLNKSQLFNKTTHFYKLLWSLFTIQQKQKRYCIFFDFCLQNLIFSLFVQPGLPRMEAGGKTNCPRVSTNKEPCKTSSNSPCLITRSSNILLAALAVGSPVSPLSQDLQNLSCIQLVLGAFAQIARPASPPLL